MKTLIVVSGGDAPGINAVIAAFARLAARQHDRVYGAENGFAGLLAGQMHEISLPQVTLLAGRGGSVLSSSRQPVLDAADARERLLARMVEHRIDNLLLFGGDGTIRHVLPLLTSWGITCVALPTTIDNDVPGTEYTLGHDSACNYAFQTIEGIKATAHALPGRIFMVETLGGDSGYLALAIAYASGADAALLPEYEFNLGWLAKRLKTTVALRGYALVVLSEGVPDIGKIAEQIPNLTGIRLRYTGLGHAQRGADVSHRDRCTAQDMSRIAYKAFKQGLGAATVVTRQGKLTLQEGTIDEADKPPPDFEQYAAINEL